MVVALLSLALFCASGAIARLEKVLDDEFLSGVNDTRVTYNMSGLALSVVRQDAVETASMGIRSEDGDPMTTDTLFHIASCSKSFTATAMGILMDDFKRGLNQTSLPTGVEQFNWRTKVKDLLPDEWGLQDTMASDYASVHDILSHVSGLSRHDLSTSANDSVRDVVRNLRNLRPAYELREQFSYNNLMYIVATHIVTKYSGMPFTKFVQRRLFDPLNMTSATYNPSPPKLTAAWSKKGRLLPPSSVTLPHQVDVEAGPGGIMANVYDLSHYLRVLLNNGMDPVTKASIIPRDVLEAITTPYTVQPDNVASSYGMGWNITNYHDSKVISHTGGIPGYSSLVLWVPSKRSGLVLLTNGDVAVEVLRYVQARFLEKIFSLSPSSEAPMKMQQDELSQAMKVYDSQQQSFSIPPIADYEGAYAASGYAQDILLCQRDSDDPACSPVLNVFATLGPLKQGQFFVRWSDNVFISHLRFVPTQDGNGYTVEATALYPQGFGKDTSPFELVVMELHAEFDVIGGVVRGFGLYEPGINQTLRPKKIIQEGCDIWFAKKGLVREGLSSQH